MGTIQNQGSRTRGMRYSSPQMCAACLARVGFGVKVMTRLSGVSHTQCRRIKRALGVQQAARRNQYTMCAVINATSRAQAEAWRNEWVGVEPEECGLWGEHEVACDWYARYTLAHCSWVAARRRCTNASDPAWPDYGGRGITMHSAWQHSFTAFVQDVGLPMQVGLTIDRIDNDKGYEPGNVRWATRTRQQRNQRRTTWVTLDGERMALRDACERRGLIFSTIYNRIYQYGWSVEAALEL
jgi:hypothetical protein